MNQNRSVPEAIGSAPAGAENADLFSSIISAVERSLRPVLLVTAAVAILLAGALGAVRLLKPVEQIFNRAIELEFLNSENGMYPNETAFALSDIIAPNILAAVYDANDLKSLGLKFSDFASSVSIEPFAPTMKEAVERYRERLADRKLTFTEKQAIEEEMRNEISILSRQNAMLTLSFSRHVPLPPQLGGKLLGDIVSMWSKDSVERRGVLKLPESLDNADLIDVKLAESLDYNLAIELVQDGVKRLKARSANLKVFSGSLTLIDPKSGMNILSLDRRLESVEDFVVRQVGAQVDQFGISRDKDFTKISLSARIGQLEQAKVRTEQERLAVQKLRENFRNAIALEAGKGQAGGRADKGEGLAGSSVIPQLSGDFIDKILSLRDNRSDAEFLQKLANEELELERKGITDAHEISRLRKTREAMSQASPEAQLVEGRLLQDLKSSVVTLNEFWQISGRLYEQVNKSRLGLAGSLYRDVALPAGARLRHPIERMLTLGAYLGAVFAFAALALMIAVLRQLLAGRRRSA